MSRINLFASLVALVVFLTVISVSQAAVIYGEDFEGGTNGQSILDPPFSFTSNFGPAGYLIKNTTPFGPSLAVDGTSNTGLAMAIKDITGPTGAPGTVYTLISRLYSDGNANDSFIGLAKPDKNGGLSFNNSGAYIGYSGGRWRFDTRGVRTGADADVVFLGAPGELLITIVDATIKIDIDANTVTGTVTDGVTTLTNSFVGGNDFSNITRFVIQERFDGMSVDNILIQETGAVTLVPGDFDGDADVDGADFVIWQTHFPTASGATLATGDADGDGDVDGADFVVWQTHFPTLPGPGVSSVPKPSAFGLGLVAIVAFGSMRRRQRQWFARY